MPTPEPTPRDHERKFWQALAADRVMMLGLDGVEDGHARPMTGLIEDGHGPIWFFTSTDSALVALLGRGDRAIANFVAKGHDLFATVRGRLTLDTNRAVVDRLWSPFVAAWYSGKDDPKLALLRLDAEEAEIWLDATTPLSGIKVLLGITPVEDQKASVATVRLD